VPGLTTENLTVHALRMKGVPDADIAAAINDSGKLQQLLNQIYGPASSIASKPQDQTSKPPAPDKYHQAAIEEIARRKQAGIPLPAGYTQRLLHGFTFGWDGTLAGGAFAPIEAYKRGVSLPEGYRYAQAREDELLDEARKNTGVLGDGVEALGKTGRYGAVMNQGFSVLRRFIP
jgi:hypothetical protein